MLPVFELFKLFRSSFAKSIDSSFWIASYCIIAYYKYAVTKGFLFDTE